MSMSVEETERALLSSLGLSKAAQGESRVVAQEGVAAATNAHSDLEAYQIKLQDIEVRTSMVNANGALLQAQAIQAQDELIAKSDPRIAAQIADLALRIDSLTFNRDEARTANANPGFLTSLNIALGRTNPSADDRWYSDQINQSHAQIASLKQFSSAEAARTRAAGSAVTTESIAQAQAVLDMATMKTLASIPVGLIEKTLRVAESKTNSAQSVADTFARQADSDAKAFQVSMQMDERNRAIELQDQRLQESKLNAKNARVAGADLDRKEAVSQFIDSQLNAIAPFLGISKEQGQHAYYGKGETELSIIVKSMTEGDVANIPFTVQADIAQKGLLNNALPGVRSYLGTVLKVATRIDAQAGAEGAGSKTFGADKKAAGQLAAEREIAIRKGVIAELYSADNSSYNFQEFSKSKEGSPKTAGNPFYKIGAMLPSGSTPDLLFETFVKAVAPKDGNPNENSALRSPNLSAKYLANYLRHYRSEISAAPNVADKFNIGLRQMIVNVKGRAIGKEYNLADETEAVNYIIEYARTRAGLGTGTK